MTGVLGGVGAVVAHGSSVHATPISLPHVKPTSTDIDDVKVFPFFAQSLLEGSKATYRKPVVCLLR